MDWSNERYVRVYTRDTTDWLALTWQARALFVLLLRKVDRSGVLDMGKQGTRGVAGLLTMPLDVVASALSELVDDGCLECHGNSLVVPNFLEAQEARQSDRQRARESRARRRERVREADDVTNRDTDTDVTNRDVTVRDDDDTNRDGPTTLVDNSVDITERDASVTIRDVAITKRDASVTRGHTRSHAVTRGHSSLTSLTSLEEEKNPPPPARAIPGSTDTAPRQSESPELLARRACAETLWNAHQRARKAVGAALGHPVEVLPATDNGRRLLAERIADQVAAGADLAEVERRGLAVISRLQAECERDRTVRWLAGSLWESRRYDMALSLVGEPVAPDKRINGTHGTRRRGIGVLFDRIAEAEAREGK